MRAPGRVCPVLALAFAIAAAFIPGVARAADTGAAAAHSFDAVRALVDAFTQPHVRPGPLPARVAPHQPAGAPAPIAHSRPPAPREHGRHSPIGLGLATTHRPLDPTARVPLKGRQLPLSPAVSVPFIDAAAIGVPLTLPRTLRTSSPPAARRRD